MRTALALGVVFVLNLGVNRPTPLVLEKNEGEVRQWRALSGKPNTTQHFVLKIDPMNGGSTHFVLGTEVFGPGDSIHTHRHPSSDELLLVNSGSARVRVGSVVGDVHAGGVVFIPTDTWVTMAVTGSDSVNITFIFSSPGFEQFMRAESVREGEKNIPLTPAESDSLDRQFAHHVVYR
jgi:quercetin dioxygenase-like cupin family protein